MPDPNDQVATVTYPLRDGWQVVVEQDFAQPTAGPTRLTIEAATEWPQPTADGEYDFGPLDSEGIQQVHLRQVPLREARKALEDQWLERLGSTIAGRIPADFTAGGDVALARLADTYVMLWGNGVRNPVTVIAKACEPHVQGTWAARVRRAKERGFLKGTDRGSEAGEPSLGASARALIDRL